MTEKQAALQIALMEEIADDYARQADEEERKDRLL
jgi:hypothetical protein